MVKVSEMQELHNVVCACCLNVFTSILPYSSGPLPGLLLGSLTFASFFHKTLSYPLHAYILSEKPPATTFSSNSYSCRRNSLGRTLEWFFATIIMIFAWCPRSKCGSVEGQKLSSKSPISLFSILL